ncbi:hypothetical protein B9Q13_01795 [Candidatus Marsarchaeota G2 archaeon ECH_B_SAG-G16]|uniref:Uncharacterized protein n=1 Tax=Candidatus Marsarchaeota G2 archaeon ECH_B_SAG-G16 TaxID=1978167 RepID=A0A2R6C3I6_9ARCH|nr:MAG: hypothetical protein B9Q13_01795 [Candidatus Marsarchaeota G2 archaeon ECH_B_SAG-G16]
MAFCELGKHQIQKSSNWRFYQALFEHLKIKNCRRVGWFKKLGCVANETVVIGVHLFMFWLRCSTLRSNHLVSRTKRA